MSHQFKEQGGAAAMDPSPLKRWLSSKVIMHLNSDRRLEKRRERGQKMRGKKRVGVMLLTTSIKWRTGIAT
jgi:hypothetical protein